MVSAAPAVGFWPRSDSVKVQRRPIAGDPRLAGTLSLVVAALLLVASVAGLVFGRSGLYTPDPATLPTFLGQDAMTLALGLPLLLGGLWSARRGSLRGLLVWIGTLFYVAYSYLYYPLSPEFNALYLVYITIVSASGYALLHLLLAIDAGAVRARFSDRTPTRLLGGFMAVMGALFTAKWVAAIASALAAGTTPTHVDLTVWPLDLIVALPALFWGGVWLWRRQDWGYVVGGLLLMKMALLGFTLLLDTWLVTLWGRPVDPTAPFYAAVALGGLVGTVVFLRCVDPVPHAAAARAARLLAAGTPTKSRGDDDASTAVLPFGRLQTIGRWPSPHRANPEWLGHCRYGRPTWSPVGEPG